MKLVPCLILSLTMPLAALAGEPAAPSSAPVELARVNGEAITDADLKRAFVGKHGGHTVFLGGEAEARRFLNVVIDEKLLVQEAYALGLEEDPSIKPQVEELRTRKSVEYLLKQEIDDRSKPTEAEIRAAWERADVLFLANEIMADTKAEAESIRGMLLRGASIQELARSCSTSPTRTRGGTLAPFTWGSLDQVIEDAAFAMQPGEISPVLHTKEGWRVIGLIDRTEAYRPPLDEKVSARLASKLTERKKEALTRELSERLWKKYEAHVVEETIVPRDLAKMLAAAPKTELASWNGGALTLEDAFTAGELRMFAALSPGRAAEQIETTLRAAVNTALVKLEAREQKIHELAAVAEPVAREEAKLIESLLYANHVLAGVKVEDADVRAAYEAEKNKMIVPEKRRVSHIAVATEAEAKALRARIQKGEDFVDLMKKHSLDNAGLKNDGDLGWIAKGKVDAVYDELFTLAVGGVGAPIQSPSAWHLVRVNAIELEHPLSYDEAKEKIRTSVLEKKKHDARQVWIRKLREAGEIEILEAGIAAYVKANPYEDPNAAGRH
jgi:parvulin-like peptidyl-prolyl isomerase